MVWLAKLADITKLGWPVPQPRFTSRPLASKMMRLPSGKITWSTWGLISSQRDGASVATWISLWKWPMLQTMAWSFIASICSWRITSLLPVQVTKMSALSPPYSTVTTLYPPILPPPRRGRGRVGGIVLGPPAPRRQGPQGLGRALADIAVTGHHGHLAGDHHIGGALDAVDQRLAAAIQVVELALGHRIVHVDCAKQQRALGRHLLEAVHAGGGLLGHADDRGALAAVPVRVCGQSGTDGGEQTAFFFAAGVGDQRGIFLRAPAQVHQQRGVAAIVQNQVGACAGAKVENAVA